MSFVALLGFGGAERRSVSLSLALDQRRFVLEYGCIRRCGDFVSELADRQIPVTEYPLRRLFGPGTIAQQLRLARHLSARRIEVVHSHNFYGNVFAVPAAWLAGAPVVIASIRDCGGDLTPIQRYLQRAACRLADCVLVAGESTRQALVADGYDPTSLVVIRSDVELQKDAAGRRPGLRAELGLPEGVPIVGMTAPLNPNEGIEDFIDAAAIVSWGWPDAVFLIVGEAHRSDAGTVAEKTPCVQTIVDRIQRLGLRDKVRLVGHHADVAGLLGELSVMVQPSPSEGPADILLKSMAAGVPVVATGAGGTPEAIEHGETGLLVPPGDPQELATAIAQVLQDRSIAARLGAAGRDSVRSRFSLEKVAQATEQLYLDLLQRKAGRPGWRTRIGLARPPFERRAYACTSPRRIA